tara:strand:+ start:231 stop:413 length:183 start_codon:yes stop_codon:yes gene_type:complete
VRKLVKSKYGHADVELGHDVAEDEELAQRRSYIEEQIKINIFREELIKDMQYWFNKCLTV